LIQQLKKADYTVQELCQALSLPISSYYYQTREKPLNIENEKCLMAIKTIAAETGFTYGKRRMRIALADQGIQFGLYKTASLMKLAQVKAIKPKNKHYYPDAGKSSVKADHHLKRAFNPPHKHSHWVGDITYIRHHQGWSYLACVLDLATREVVGYALSERPNAQLAIAALDHAIKKHQPYTANLMFHSDLGVQYSAERFTQHLHHLKIKQSMSRRGNCWDNAVMERFFRSLKSERLNHLSFINHYAVINHVEDYIYFYNYKRLHSAIGYLTPAGKAKITKKAA
jgi:putative transposase